MIMEIEFTQKEIVELQKLIFDFNSYYESEKEWSFNDLDAQREISREIVSILETKKLT
jgi:hypothetical protein